MVDIRCVEVVGCRNCFGIEGLLAGHNRQHFHAKGWCHFELKRIAVATERKALISLHMVAHQWVRQEMHDFAIGLVVIDPQKCLGVGRHIEDELFTLKIGFARCLAAPHLEIKRPAFWKVLIDCVRHLLYGARAWLWQGRLERFG